jgi:transcriptional regulator with XRE-family HTH domain
MTFGTIIKQARLDAKLSQKQLASLIIKEDGEPMSPPYLNDIEHDRSTPSSHHLIKEFARVLKVEPEILYFAAGRIPKFRSVRKVERENVVAAFRAFERALRGAAA